MTNDLVVREQADEVRSLATLGFDELSGAIGGIGQLHQGIAERVFWALGPTGAVARAAHDGISSAVYAGIRGATWTLGRGADAALALREAPAERVVSTSRMGSAGLAALTGLIGDTLERDGSDLAEPMAVRVHGRIAGLDGDALATAFPRASGKLVVFLHGLMETEFSWRGVYGASLERDLGYTPVYVRYNSGRHVSENGRSLADLLAALAAAWPVDVERIALVGHSMGGLVARSACHQAAEEGAGLGRARPPRGVARHPPPGRAARAGGPLCERGPAQAARDAPARGVPAPAQRRDPRPARGLARRRGLA